MSHHLLVAAVLLSACCILVANAGMESHEIDRMDIDSEPIGSNPKKRSLSNGAASSEPLSESEIFEEIMKKLENNINILLDLDKKFSDTVNPIFSDELYEGFRARIDSTLNTLTGLVQDYPKYEADPRVKSYLETVKEIQGRNPE